MMCAGRILGDLIASGVVPTTHLCRVFRQAAMSSIISNAHLVNRGRVPKKMWCIEDEASFGSSGVDDPPYPAASLASIRASLQSLATRSKHDGTRWSVRLLRPP